MRPLEIDWTKRFGERCRREADGWQVCTALSLTEAEELLDWLESSGIGEREMSFGESGAAVRWRQ
jgi:hypothetical protein